MIASSSRPPSRAALRMRGPRSSLSRQARRAALSSVPMSGGISSAQSEPVKRHGARKIKFFTRSIWYLYEAEGILALAAEIGNESLDDAYYGISRQDAKPRRRKKNK